MKTLVVLLIAVCLAGCEKKPDVAIECHYTFGGYNCSVANLSGVNGGEACWQIVAECTGTGFAEYACAEVPNGKGSILTRFVKVREELLQNCVTANILRLANMTVK